MKPKQTHGNTGLRRIPENEAARWSAHSVCLYVSLNRMAPRRFKLINLLVGIAAWEEHLECFTESWSSKQFKYFLFQII